MSTRALLRQVYNRLAPAARFDGHSLKLGFIFHTEQVQDALTYRLLERFCEAYQGLTGAKAICTVMSGANARIRHEMGRCGTSPKEYRDRVQALSERATLGYHGHFWLDPERFGAEEQEIRSNNYLEAPVRAQMAADLAWFKESGLDHHGVYAAGWWFMNRGVLQLLLEHGFRHDFSFSRVPWFRSQFGWELLQREDIAAGQSFAVKLAGLPGKLTCTQNLVGGGGASSPEDCARNLAKLIEGAPEAITGVLNLHDYDLTSEADFERSLACVRFLQDRPGVQFLGLDALTEPKLSRVVQL